jgi:hypothetical protein
VHKRSQTVVCASGRFGNQIFQLSLAIFIGRKYGIPILVDFRGTAPKNIKLMYHSGLISKNESVISLFQKLYLEGSIVGLVYDYLFRVRAYFAFRLNHMTGLSLPKIRFSSNPRYIDDNQWQNIGPFEGRIYGYFQDSNLIEKVWEEMCSRFLKSKLNLDSALENNLNYVIAHVRLTDYILHSEIGIIGSNYYLNAFKVFDKHKIYIATDSVLQFKKIHFSLRDYTNFLPDTNDDSDTFILMANSKNLILANSSFSYWAGIFSLMKFNDSLIIAPTPWRVDGNNQSILSHRFKLINRY